MADISRLSAFINGVARGIDLTSNTLVTQSIKVGGGVSNTELTKAILDRLVALQNGSDVDATYHTHDGRYYTETEIGSTSGTSGADLVGIRDAANQFTATTVEGALAEALDAAQAAQADLDDLVTLSGVAANSTDLGTFTGAIIPDASDIKEALQALETAEEATQDDVADLVTLSGVAANSVDLGTFTGTVIADSSTIKQALQSLETYSENTRSLIQNFEWANSVISIELDSANIVAPSTGDRYLIAGTGLNDFAGQDNKIAEWNGSAYVFTTPTLGTFVAVDDESDGLYLFNGTAWDKKYFEATTASQGLTKVGFDIRLASANQNGINVTSGVLSVNVDDTSIERTAGAGNPLAIKNSGVTTAKIAANAVDGSKILLAHNQWLRGVDDAESEVNILKIGAANLPQFELPILGDIFYTPAVLADWDGAGDPGQLTQAVDQLAARVKDLETAPVAPTDAIVEDITAGESFAAATPFAVRMAKAADAGFVAGRVYKADIDASSADDFHVVGIALEASSTAAGDPISVTKMGRMTITAHGFTVGQPIYLAADGALSNTVPSAANEAVVKVGIARDANTIEVAIQVMYVN